MPAAADDGVPRIGSLPERALAAAADRMPLGVRSARLAPSARAAGALAIVGLLAALAAAVVLLRDRPHEVRAPLTVSSTGLKAAGPSAPGSPGAGLRSPPASAAGVAGPAPSAAALLVVDVVGPVRRPGVVRLPAGARVVDALAAAGGLKPGASPGMLNLAAVVADGQQIVVGGPASPGTGPTSAGSAPAPVSPGSSPALVDLNSATLEQLDGLPGVGPVLAQRILDWRTANGRFTAVEQLAEVAGIGERKLADLRKRVRV